MTRGLGRRATLAWRGKDEKARARGVDHANYIFFVFFVSCFFFRCVFLQACVSCVPFLLDVASVVYISSFIVLYSRSVSRVPYTVLPFSRSLFFLFFSFRSFFLFSLHFVSCDWFCRYKVVTRVSAFCTQYVGHCVGNRLYLPSVVGVVVV